MPDTAGEHSIGPHRWMTAALAFLPLTCIFYFYAYNSGYGYDACDYMVIGRSLLEGFRISDFILAKGWALYAMTGLSLAVIPAPNHTWIAFVVTVWFALAVAGTWWVGHKLFGPAVAALSALLVAACAFFMEANFLEPEIPVYLCGLLAFYTLESGRSGWTALRCVPAGLALGVGFNFKAVALFYLAGIFAYLLFNQTRLPLTERLRTAMWIALGFGVAVILPAGYFAATGQLQHHIMWSYVFPLFHYPGNTFFLAKLYTKLLWFFVLLFGVSLLACTHPLRQKLFANPRVWLVLWMGALSLSTLIKTQASHFVFPGGAFLSFFIAETLYRWWSLKPDRRRIPAWLPAAALVLMLVSAYLYNPSSLTRLVRKRDFSAEDQVASRLEALASPDSRVLFLQGSVGLYWTTHRYPNVPFVDTDIQTSYFLFQQPEVLVRALDDPRLKLVTFDPQNPEFEDPRFLATEHHRDLIRRFSERLQERFTPLRDPALPLNLWVRKAWGT